MHKIIAMLGSPAVLSLSFFCSHIVSRLNRGTQHPCNHIISLSFLPACIGYVVTREGETLLTEICMHVGRFLYNFPFSLDCLTNLLDLLQVPLLYMKACVCVMQFFCLL